MPIGVNPDGFNINRDCGSVHTDFMREQVVAHGADLGIALDGDADRLVLSDEHGELVDGDQLMAAIADYWLQTGKLNGGGVATTVMSNLGLERFLQGLGLDMHRTQVGDRYVLEAMRRLGLNVGGEQSGHIILSDFCTTGDGLIAALQVLALVVAAGKPVSDVCRCFQPLPQLLKNVRYKGDSPLASDSVSAAIKAQEKRLGTTGRVLIRPSGTEPVIRVMAEGEDEALIGNIVDELCHVISQAGAVEAAE